MFKHFIITVLFNMSIPEVVIDIISNKAIRDGKYLAVPHSSALFRDVISLLARVFIFLIEVTLQKYLKEIVVHVFKIYAIELLGSLPADEA